MTDLETRVRDTLTDHAGAAGPWQLSGTALRETAAHRRRTRRLRATAALGAAAAVVVTVAGVSLSSGGGTDRAPLPGATDRPTTDPTRNSTATRPAEPRPELLQVPVADDLVEQAVSTFALGDSELLATAVLPGAGETVLVFREQLRGDDNGAAVQTVTVDRQEMRAGTLTLYRPDADVIAQPARDGDGSTLVVVAPPGSEADSVEVTTSLPGEDIDLRSADLRDGLALVELPAAQSATRLRLLRQGITVADTIPGGYHLGEEVPRPLGQVVAETGDYERVQVRTNGRSACRVTVSGLDGANPFLTPWNPISEGCAAIDPGRLQLLAPDDRRYSSVAGLAPAGTDVVRLFWRVGKDTESNDVGVTRSGGAIAFIDTSLRSPDQLIRAEAWSADGEVLATARPAPLTGT